MNREEEDFTDEVQHKKRKKKHQIRTSSEREDIAEVLNLASGRRLLWRIMEETRMFAPDLFVSDSDSSTFCNLGSRNIGIWLYNEITRSDPGAFIKMMDKQLQESQDG